MYLQSGKSKPKIRSIQRRTEQDRSLLSRLPGIFKALVLFAVLAGICNAYIYLNQQRNNTARSIARLRTDLLRIENETINERNRGERLRDWPSIQAQIRRYQLPLELPDRGQRRQIALLTPQQAANVHYQAAARAVSDSTAVASTAVQKSRRSSAAAPVFRKIPVPVSVEMSSPVRSASVKYDGSMPLRIRSYRKLRKR